MEELGPGTGFSKLGIASSMVAVGPSDSKTSSSSSAIGYSELSVVSKGSGSLWLVVTGIGGADRGGERFATDGTDGGGGEIVAEVNKGTNDCHG